jgi:formate/nitrite transporter FocA (FNT family)
MTDEVGSARVEDPAALRGLATIALLAIVLGIVIQILILVAKLSGGLRIPGVNFLVDLAQGVTWSLLVCTGVAIGTSVLKARAALAGILSAIFAPVAIGLAKAVQRMVAGLLDVAEQQAILSLGSVSLLRAVEYGALGFLLGTLAQKSEKRFHRYLVAGLAVGVVLGGAVLGLTAYFARRDGLPFGSTQVATGVINEIVFPVGCAIVIYAGQLVGRTFSRTELVLK